jgi:hypothetical protein
MVKSAPTSTARLTQVDGGGHTGWVKGAGPVTWDSSRAGWRQPARSHLRGADPMLARLIDDRPAFDPRAWLAQRPPMDLFGALLLQVTGEKLSLPATRGALVRVEALFGGHLRPPAELLAVDRGRLRAAGLSLSGTTRVGDRLEGQGMLRQERCPGDGRGRHAVLTDLDLPTAAAALSHVAIDYAHRSV